MAISTSVRHYRRTAATSCCDVAADMARDYGGKLLSPNDEKLETITGTLGRSDAKKSMLCRGIVREAWSAA